eukprot:14105996-Alexandrium_andersonii.AAC.1
MELLRAPKSSPILDNMKLLEEYEACTVRAPNNRLNSCPRNSRGLRSALFSWRRRRIRRRSGLAGAPEVLLG